MKRTRSPEQKAEHARKMRIRYSENREKILAGQKEFYIRNRDRCKQASKEYYEINRDKISDSLKDRRQKLNLLKLDRCCYDCGGMFPPEAMQWDHIPGKEKFFEVGTGERRKLSEVMDEIAKCQLVCANCHAVRTVSRRRKPKNWDLE